MTHADASIAAVERETGIGKDTLRVWERRYGFPAPSRDALGERLYPNDQVERLRLVRRLLDCGHRPGKVVGLPYEAMLALLPGPAPEAPALPSDGGTDVFTRMAWLRNHDVDALRRSFAQAVAQLGLSRFVQEVVVPMNALVGDAWMRGDLQVFEEHLYTETVTGVLRHGIHNLHAGTPGRPRVLLTTLPKEAHGLGLLMAETLMALEGCACLSLGPQTPVGDIVRAAISQRSDAVALSFTGSLSTKYVLSGLGALRAQLPPTVAIWVGGQCPALYRRTLPGITPLPNFEALSAHLKQWQRAAV
ncbi:MAG: MerR family transcriptional regulator [Pseudomonadota bacterium]